MIIQQLVVIPQFLCPFAPPLTSSPPPQLLASFLPQLPAFSLPRLPAFSLPRLQERPLQEELLRLMLVERVRQALHSVHQLRLQKEELQQD